METKIREPAIGKIGAWAALQGAMVLSFATWQALAVLAGFDPRISWEMALVVDGYVVSSLALWMARVPAAIASFARKNTYAAAAIGVVAQSAYHATTVALARRTWPVVVLAATVGAVPPLFAALSIHARALIRRHALLALAADVNVPATVTFKPAAAPAVTVTAASVVPPVAPADTAIATDTAAPATADDESDTDTDDDMAGVMDAVAEPKPRATVAPSAMTAASEKRELAKKLLRQGDSPEQVAANVLGVSLRSAYRYQKQVRDEQGAELAGARP